MGNRDAGPPNRILFVEEMTGLIAESLPEFWKLGQAYISGTLFQGMQMVTERAQLQQENCGKNKKIFEVTRSTSDNRYYVDVIATSNDIKLLTREW